MRFEGQRGCLCDAVWHWTDWCLLIARASLARCFHFSVSCVSPPSFTAISRIPLSPIFRSQACNYVGLLVHVCVCAHSWKEEGGKGGVVKPATSSWCINYPLSVSVTYTYTHTHTHTCTQTQSWLFTDTKTKIYSHSDYKWHCFACNYAFYAYSDIELPYLRCRHCDFPPIWACEVSRSECHLQGLQLWCVCEFSRVSVTQSSTDQMFTTPVIWSFSVRIAYVLILEAVVTTFSLWNVNDGSVTWMFLAISHAAFMLQVEKYRHLQLFTSVSAYSDHNLQIVNSD